MGDVLDIACIVGSDADSRAGFMDNVEELKALSAVPALGPLVLYFQAIIFGNSLAAESKNSSQGEDDPFLWELRVKTSKNLGSTCI
jgi:hypothetical protein